MTADQFATFSSSIWGALLGSISAYALGMAQQARTERSRRHAALLNAYFALASQWNALEGIRRSALEPHRDRPNRALTIPVFLFFSSSVTVEFKEISFIALSRDPNLLNQIHLAEQRYVTAIASLRERNQRLEELYQRDTVNFDFATGKGQLKAEPKDVYLITALTDNLYMTVDRALQSLQEELNNIRNYTKKHFRGMRRLAFEPDQAP